MGRAFAALTIVLLFALYYLLGKEWWESLNAVVFSLIGLALFVTFVAHTSITMARSRDQDRRLRGGCWAGGCPNLAARETRSGRWCFTHAPFIEMQERLLPQADRDLLDMVRRARNE